jgi:predicted heme/steroid binding protein
METNLTKYSTTELLNRDGRKSKEIWVAYKGKIYDVSTSDLFEDGDHYGHLAGRDLTIEMEDAPHLDDVLENFPIVGILI